MSLHSKMKGKIRENQARREKKRKGLTSDTTDSQDEMWVGNARREK